jgi:pimeloyl-ACP methyl ester carboxylesterase
MKVTMKYFLSFVLSLSLSAATVDGLKIHSSTTGNGPNTVILVHGWTCDDTTWTEQVPVLAKQYRVVTLDLPGHGQSESPKDGKFSMDLFARAIEAVRAEVKADQVVLAGHSMGSPVVIRYAQLYPQHTMALVLVDGLMPATQNANAKGVAPSNRGAAMAGPDGRKNRETMIRGFFSVSTTTAIQTKILNMMLGAPEATAVGAMNATFTATAPTDYMLRMPTLGIYAGRSPMASSQSIQAHFPNSEYTQIPDTGHFLMLEKPEEFNRLLLAFLAKQKY